MRGGDFISGWGKILRGKLPLLSIEITSECPLSCPGCYAYGDRHLGGGVTLTQLSDSRGETLVQGILRLVDRHDPMQLSLVGGEPMMRHRELNQILPILSARGIYTMVVTSGVIPIPPEWTELPRVTVAISVDGLPEHHDVRRKPATYDRILRNIAGSRVYIHWTAVRAHVQDLSYAERYLEFWSARPEVHRIWMSVYTPQRGEQSAELLLPEDRKRLAEAIPWLAAKYPKFLIKPGIARAILSPPSSPRHCTFARVSANYTADLRTRVAPCVFGGDPDCSQCGCAISSALHWISNEKAGPIAVRHLLNSSLRIGEAVARMERAS
ncbi:MAG TPA: radical SAM protein [Bryobacteraceae bacterium]|nr:radical SAM protein [Bryobacteraceae bacterium]